jgi:hypothetical protein
VAIYILENKTLFIHISKAGGTSVSKWLNQNFHTNKIAQKHCRIARVLQTNIKFEKHFTIVRNPFARIHSWYYYHKQLASSDNLVDKKGLWKQSSNKTFSDWLETTCKDGTTKNSIWWTQKSFIAVDLPHIICRLENIETEFTKIQRHFNCFAPLPVTNTSSHNHYRKDYTPETRKIIETHFQEDFEYFGYDF